MSSALLCNGSHAVDPLGRSHSLETCYDKEGMLGLHSPLSKGPHSTPKQYHAPAPMLRVLLCNGSQAMDPPRRSYSLETRLDRGHAQLPLLRIYMLRTMDEMKRTGRTGGWTGAQADEGSERTSKHAGRRADGRTNGLADGGGQWAEGQTGGQGRADARTGRQTGGRRISEGKILDLTRQLTWPWEIQRGRPRVIVKLPHLPPPSRKRQGPTRCCAVIMPILS